MKKNLITVAVSFAATFAFLALAGSVGAGPAVDTDGDGIQDGLDNCRVTANLAQQDSDRDGAGNICDADLNNDNLVAIPDFGIWFAAFPSVEGGATYNAIADLNSDGLVAIPDFGLWFARFPSVVDPTEHRAGPVSPPAVGTSL